MRVRVCVDLCSVHTAYMDRSRFVLQTAQLKTAEKADWAAEGQMEDRKSDRHSMKHKLAPYWIRKVREGR
ncbi:hypothetical protein SRHO_G00298420 [Serrasalmus rhombeus]